MNHIPVNNLPAFYKKITLYPSIIATFYTPSDISGINEMHCKYI